MASIPDGNLGKLVLEGPTILDSAAATDDGGIGGANRNLLRRAELHSDHPTTNTRFYRPDDVPVARTNSVQALASSSSSSSSSSPACTTTSA